MVVIYSNLQIIICVQKIIKSAGTQESHFSQSVENENATFIYIFDIFIHKHH